MKYTSDLRILYVNRILQRTRYVKNCGRLSLTGIESGLRNIHCLLKHETIAVLVNTKPAQCEYVRRRQTLLVRPPERNHRCGRFCDKSIVQAFSNCFRSQVITDCIWIVSVCVSHSRLYYTACILSCLDDNALRCWYNTKQHNTIVNILCI